MSDLSDEQKLEHVKNHIAQYPDFPKPGILFRDIFSALADAQSCLYLRDLLVTYVRTNHADVQMIVGLESRGFLFNMLIATELGVACAPIRKKGKLPGDCISVSYALEYGEDVFELQANAFKPGQKVLIVDDLLATGGSMSAALQLLRKANVTVLGCLAVIELIALGGRYKLDCAVHSLIQY